jgi:hypothetical protein
MLGGLGEVSEGVLKSSFLSNIQDIKESTELYSPLDVGAGIGRISKFLLSRFFDSVDLLEVTQKFLDEAKKDLSGIEQIRNFYCAPIQVSK